MSTNQVSWVSSAYPEYENYEKLLKTFFDRFWPISTYQNETMMAKAGFFYPGFGDIVTCAFCGINLHKWLPHDDPIIEHKKYNNDCKFIRLFQESSNQKGNQTYNFTLMIKKFINSLRLFLQSITNCFQNLIHLYFCRSKFRKPITARIHNICKICLNEDSNILLLPCHHISTCISCTLCTTFCPICRCQIEHVIKVYFA